METELDWLGRLRRWVLKSLISLLVIIPLIFAGWAWVALNYTYATGERAGYVQKISQKGWICKTWEGELAMANLPGAMPEVFKFSVRDDAVAQQIVQSAGQRVAISYDQHRGIPTTCFGETQYFITKISPITDASQQSLPVKAAPSQAK